MATRVSRAPSRRDDPTAAPVRLIARSQRVGRRVLRLKAVGFKPHPHPPRRFDSDDEHEEKETIQQYSFKVLADMSLKEQIGSDVLQENNGWARVNPRGRKLVGPVMDAIEKTWKDHPTEFYRNNRGIVLSAESVTWDKGSNIAEVVFSDMAKHGVLDGATTLAKLVEELIPETYGVAEDDEDSDEEDDTDEDSEQSNATIPDRYLTCEVWVGLAKDEMGRLTEGRNTSRTVPPYAISNLRGDFTDVRTTLQKLRPDFEAQVAFKPHEHIRIEGDEPGSYKPVSILSILQLMMCMDVTNYSDTDHPIEAYKNQGKIPTLWDKTNERNRVAEYNKMLPILGDLLELYDRVREVVPEAYNTRTRKKTKKTIPLRWNKVLAGKQPVSNTKPEPLYYLDPSGQRKTYRSPTSLFYPIICAFRACLIATGARYEWVGGKKPTAWSEDVFRDACSALAVTIATLAQPKDSLHAVGRDEAVWTACYQRLNSFLFQHGIKKPNT